MNRIFIFYAELRVLMTVPVLQKVGVALIFKRSHRMFCLTMTLEVVEKKIPYSR